MKIFVCLIVCRDFTGLKWHFWKCLGSPTGMLCLWSDNSHLCQSWTSPLWRKDPHFHGEGSSVKPHLSLQYLCSLDCREYWKVLKTGLFSWGSSVDFSCVSALWSRMNEWCRDREKGFVVFISNNCASKLNLAFWNPLVVFQLYPSAVAHCIAEASVI